MAFQVSPGVEVKEIDATNVVPAVSTSIGGFAGAFNWGPVEQLVTVGSEQELADKFGTPDDSTAKYFLTAAAFLKYGNALKVVRVLSGHDNATGDGSGQLIKNKEDYDNNYANGSLSKGDWVAKYPGVLGNSLKVSVISQGISSFSSWTYAGSFDSAPGTSDYAVSIGKTGANDELHVAVIDEDGLLTGTAGTVLETFAFVSQGSDAKKSDGTSNYYKEVINNNSQYIWWTDHNTNLAEAGSLISSVAGNSFTTHTSAMEASLAGGSDDNAPTAGEILIGNGLFEDAETVDVNLLFGCPDANGAETIAESLISIATARKDCMAFVSPPIEDTVGSAAPATDVMAFANGLTSSSYASCDSSALYVYDKYNDVYRYIGAAGRSRFMC
jgi:hypothetical protein